MKTILGTVGNIEAMILECLGPIDESAIYNWPLIHKLVWGDADHTVQ